MKSFVLSVLIAISSACLADSVNFSRTTKFASPKQFVKVARNFHPASERSEFGYLFSAPERGHDDSTYGQLVFAETIDDVTDLWRGPEPLRLLSPLQPEDRLYAVLRGGTPTSPAQLRERDLAHHDHIIS